MTDLFVYFTLVPPHINTTATYTALSQSLPAHILKQVSKYADPQARLLKIVAKSLLQFSLKNHNDVSSSSLHNYRRTGHEKPAIEGSKIQFSISHSGQLVVCAISGGRKIGVDVEFEKSLPLELLTEYFDNPTQERFKSAADPLKLFYQKWTQREAVLKAAGTGIYNAALSEVSERGEQLIFRAKSYYSYVIDLPENYTGSLICESPSLKVNMVQVTLDELLLMA